jgi:hypothetical protein
MNLLRRLGDDETTVNQREYSRGNQQHYGAVDNQLRVISNYQFIEDFSARGVNFIPPFAPGHEQRIEQALPTQGQTLHEVNLIAHVDRVKANSECIYDFGIPCQRSRSKIDGSQNQVRNNHKNQEVFEVRSDLYALLCHTRTAEPLQHEQRDHESRLTTCKHKETAKEFSQKIDGPAHRL